MTRQPASTRIAAVLCTFFLSTASAGTRAAAQDPDEDIRLVMVVVVDQLRADYVTRFTKHFKGGGITRLMREGAHFVNAYFSFGSSATAPGHSTLSTGRLPRQHGMVGNKWYLDGTTRKSQYAIDDPNCRLAGFDGAEARAGKSAWRLIGPTLGDQLKLSDARSRVFSVAMKDRAAILMAGHNPDGVFWWEDNPGRWVSSTWYSRALPAWVLRFNEERWADRYSGQTWSPLLGESAYSGSRPVEDKWLLEEYGFGHAFPHKLRERTAANGTAFHASLSATPLGNELVLEMARRTILEEKLGGGPATDLFFVGFSSNDLCGHVFGPESPEVLDLTVRTDQQIAALLELVDKQVGLKRCLVVVTADHGVSSIPQQVQAVRQSGGLIDFTAIVKALNARFNESPPGDGGIRDPILGVNVPWVYFHPGVRRLPPAIRERVLETCVQRLRNEPGVVDVFTSTELAGAPPSRDDLYRWLAWRGFHPERSGDIYIQLAPGWAKKGDNTAGHSCAFTHDRHVPILLMGARIKPGRYFAPADPMDIPVTLSILLSIEPPAEAVGRVLHEALDTVPPR